MKKLNFITQKGLLALEVKWYNSLAYTKDLVYVHVVINSDVQVLYVHDRYIYM